MLLNEDYVVSKFYQHAGSPRYNRLSKSYNGCCPTCREGNSWGKKRRLYYIPRKNLIFCHNCGLSTRPVKWVQTVGNMSYIEVMKENANFARVDIDLEPEEKKIVDIVVESLPKDSINLSDKQQVSFYKDNFYVNKALEVIKNRRLDTAENKPKSFWISLTDSIHKNRLVIPFYDTDGNIVHYQSRTIVEKKGKEFPKYLSKQNSEKTMFGINNIDDQSKYIFITEGPLDACFLKNGLAVAGINESKGCAFTKRQQEQIAKFPLHEIVWVLDNQRIDKASKKKTAMLTKSGYKVFLWPEELQKFKDINEVCIAARTNIISERFILKHTYSGIKANLMLSKY